MKSRWREGGKEGRKEGREAGSKEGKDKRRKEGDKKMFGLNFGKNKFTYEEFVQLIEEDKSLKIIDVRGVDEFKTGHIPNAINIPLNILEFKIDDYNIKKDDTIVLYCLSGGRANMAMSALKSKGFTNMKNFGGVSNWNGTLEK